MAPDGRRAQPGRMAASSFLHRVPAPFGVAVGTALVAGVSAAAWLPALPPWPLSAAVLACGLPYWWRGGRLRWLGAFAAGFGWLGLQAAWVLAAQLPPSWEGRDARVGGRVVGLPAPEARRTRFRFRVDDDAAQPAPLRGRLLQLSWYDDFDATAPGPRTGLRAGERWRFDLRLRAPRGLRNPGGFDGERHALAQRVAARGYVRHAAKAQRLAPPAGVDAWRERMSARIAAALSAPASGAASARFVQALALGDTRSLDDRDWETLRAAGLTHLIAISGFHVGMVAGGFGLAAAGLWWLLPGLGRRWPRPQAAAIVAVLAAVAYAAAAGFSLPTVRTVLMIAVAALARLWRRPAGVGNALALAAVAVLAFDPLSVLAAGFWLSFAGVAWLAWCLPQRPRPPLLRGFLAAQWVATLGLLPLSALLFHQASLAGPLANLAAIPWWSLVVVPLALVGTGLEAVAEGAGAWAWRAGAACFAAAWPGFVWLAEGRFALRWLAEPAWYALPLACLGAFWWLLPRGVPGRRLALLLWLPLLWPDRRLPGQGEARVTMLDVGQGLAVLVRTANHALLYDAGPAVRDGFDAGERAVVPALRALGVVRLQRAVISHADADHAGGFEAVWRSVPVDEVALPAGAPALPGLAGDTQAAENEQAARDAAAPGSMAATDARWGLTRGRSAPPRRDCLAGEGWTWDGVRFRFLHPTPHFPYFGNEASCVLRVETAHGAVLLTGDIGEVVERELVRRDPEGVRAEVVFAPHHGSAGSSDPLLVRAAAARQVLLSTGHGNRFGHPRPDTVARWQAAGARVLNTATSGAVEVKLGGEGAHAIEWRRARPRLWDAERRARTAAILSRDG